jgi:hypothetical protein
MKKYLIISPLGDKSLCEEWLHKSFNFDIVFLYYGDNFENAQYYLKYTPHIYSAKGTKYSLIKSFIQGNLEFLSQYTHIWLPDDDVSISTDEINKLFKFTDDYRMK